MVSIEYILFLVFMFVLLRYMFRKIFGGNKGPGFFSGLFEILKSIILTIVKIIGQILLSVLKISSWIILKVLDLVWWILKKLFHLVIYDPNK